MDDDNSLVWPINISGFKINTRVDAIDHKGAWFAGTVMDSFDITEAMIKKESLVKSQSRGSSANGSVSLKNREKSDNSSANILTKTKLRPGLHIRVHFDNFSHNWDEWYDQFDLENGNTYLL